MKNKFIYSKEKFSEVNPKYLEDLNIKGVILDLDNTIFKHNQLKFEDEFESKFKELKKYFDVVILSNRINLKKKKNYHKTYDLLRTPIIKSDLPKPFFDGFNKAIKKLNLDKENVIIIGDRFGTDILGGLLFGINTMLVKPVSKKEPIIIRVIRKLEMIPAKILSIIKS